MKFRVHFKTPDTLERAIDEAVNMACNYEVIDDTEFEELREKEFLLRKEMEDTASKFIEWSECITVEFDTEAKTAIVVPN